MADLDFDTWLQALRSSDATARLQAVQAAQSASTMQVGDVASHVIVVLDDPIAEVRAAAATTLAGMGLAGDVAQQAITALMHHQDDPEPSVQQAISAALLRLEQGVEVVAESAPEIEDALAEERAEERDADAKLDRGGAPSTEIAPALDDGFFDGYSGPATESVPLPAAAPSDPIEVPVLPMSPSPFSPPSESGAPLLPPPARVTPITPPTAPPQTSGSVPPAPPALGGPPPVQAPPQQPSPTRSRQVNELSLEQRALQQEAQEVQFSAYFPMEMIPGRWFPLTAYLFKSFAAEQVLADARSTLGAWMAAVRRVISNVRRTLPEGTIITATPYMDGVQFNPPAITFGFYEDWHRLDFRLRTMADAPLYQSVNGRLTFTVEGVIVADVPLSIYVTDALTSLPNISTTDPSISNGMQTVSQKLYKSIFCSYSHDDKAIVERVERVYKALGFDFLRDVVTLKSGEDWNDKLYTLIEQADIFQLFWSSTAANSEYVEREWRHALSLDRESSNFIRPVYWEAPIPTVPQELSEIHFAYEPTLDDNL